MKRSVRHLTRLALLTAVALIIFVIEAAIPPLTTVPGVKMGLANIVTLAVLQLYGRRDALLVLLARVFLGSVFAGQMMTLLYSLSGGLLYSLSGGLLLPLFPLRRLWLLSMIGAVCHNLGQTAAAIWVTRTPELLWYLPVLLVSGLVSGCFTGWCAQFLLSRLRPAARRPHG